MTPKEKAMKWIKEQEFAFYTYATLEKILDIALKEQAKEILFHELANLEHQLEADDILIRNFKELMEKYT